jgi:5-methylcytosine-specific restriction endonuclease McrA
VAWNKTQADRERDARVYDSPEYRRNRPLAMKRDRWRCQLKIPGTCIGAASQCDHRIQPSEGGGHDLGNLRAACKPCHAKRTAGQSRAGTKAAGDPEPQPRTDWNT